MSEIRRARESVAYAIALLNEALSLMTREPPVKRAKPKRIVIDEQTCRRVRKLARQGKSNHDIAEIVGLANGGRVSEILNGKRGPKQGDLFDEGSR